MHIYITSNCFKGGAIGILLANLSAFPVLAQITGDVELLRDAAMRFRSNYDRIDTWSGVARISTQSSGMGQELSSEFSIEFAYSQRLGAARWKSVIEREFAEYDGREVKHEWPSLPSFYAGMLRDEKFYRLGRIYEAKDKGQPYMLRMYPPEELETRFLGSKAGMDFHPITLLQSSGVPFSDILLNYHRAASDPNIGDTSVTKEGTNVILEARVSTAGNRFVVDLAQGGNLVGAFTWGIDTNTSAEFTYEDVGGILVPSTVLYRDEGPQGEKYERSIRLVKNLVNEPLAEEDFTFDKIGLRPGDIVVDTQSSVRYAWQPQGIASNPRGVFRLWLAIVSIVAIAAIAFGGVMWRRLRV